MPATTTATQDLFADDADTNAAAAIDARNEDAFWSRCFHLENYCRAGLDYEDYAAAYCAGYIGYVQYGGAFEDAEKSLCSNWVRLKGDSRVSVEDAMSAIRAAWDRMASAGRAELEWSELYAMAGDASRFGAAANQPSAMRSMAVTSAIQL